jgi:fatty-acyl-CoA synthase
VCINSAGEKIYPEEVEETLKLHDSVEDALVVGVPDEKWGQAVTAVVEMAEGHSFDPEQLKVFVRGKLAGYKTPKHIFTDGPPFRAPNGKADYKSVTQYAVDTLDQNA